MGVLGKKAPEKFINEVYYKEKQLYFELFISAVQDILRDHEHAAVYAWVKGIEQDDGSFLTLDDVCLALGWPIRYCRAMLVELIEKRHIV